MPIHWTIDSQHQLVRVTIEGALTRADADGYLDAVERSGAAAYRKLVDGRAGTMGMDHDDVMAICVRIRNFHHGHPVGALAVVLSDDKSEAVARILGILATADRPIRIFAALPPAQRWIESLVGEDKKT